MAQLPPRTPNRRTFLATTASAAGAAVLPKPHALTAFRDDEIRVGLIGCGGRGTGAATQALRTEGPVRLVAMGDAFADRIDGCAKALQGDESLAGKVEVPEERRFHGFDAFQKVIACDVDLVILATPPHFRPQHFAAAIDAGKHVFMEKPVAIDGRGVGTVLAAGEVAKQKGLSVGVGLQRHHENGYREAIARVHDGQIGDIVAARCYWNQGGLWHKPPKPSWTEMEWQLRNWLYFTWLSGDHIVEQHIHNIDVINWAKRGFPVAATGMGGRQVRTDRVFGHIFDHHAVQFEYGDGSFLFSECRQIGGCFNSVSEHLIGTKGRCDMNTSRWTIEGEKPWRFDGRDGRKNNPYQTEHDDLFAAIRGGEQLLEYEYGAKSTLTAILGRIATYTGKRVTWEEALASTWPAPERYAFDAELPEWQVAMPGS